MSDRLIAVFADELGVEENSLNDSSSPDSVEEWDSLAAMRLVFAPETEFKVRLTASEIVSMKSIQIVRDVLRSKGAEV